MPPAHASSRTAWCSLLLAVATPAPAPAWEQIRDEDGIRVFRKQVAGSDLVAFRGVATVPAPLARVLGVLAVNEHRTEWVDRLYESRTLQQISPWEFIVYQAFRLPPVMSNRDYVYRGKATRDASGVVTLRMSSEPHAAAPPTVGVRARLIDSTYVLTSRGPGETEIDVRIQTDPRGWVPTWLVNLIQRSWPHKTLSGIRAQVRKPYVRDYPLPPAP